MSGDYEVGFGKPPRGHRFKKGEPSANPNGRPKGKVKRGLLEQLDKKIVVGVKNGRRVQKSIEEVIIHNLIKDTVDGDRHALQILLRWRAEAKKAAAPPKLSAKEMSFQGQQNITPDEARTELTKFYMELLAEIAPHVEEAIELGVFVNVCDELKLAPWVYGAAAEHARAICPPVSIDGPSLE